MRKWMLALVFGLTPALFAVSLTGAGATFPYPLYSKWFTEYQSKHPEAQINYQSIGSGAGIKQFLDGTLDFGASDAPMSDEQLQKEPTALHIPTVLGAVAVTFNVQGVKSLKLTPEILSGIFLGTIKEWNHKSITALNPGSKLSGEIVVVHRTDGSGTTAVFTDYLSKVSPAWKDKVGKGTAVNWPVGLGGKGNEGVSSQIQQRKGSIGYVELAYAETNHLAAAELKNRSGKFVAPSVKSVTASAQGSLASIPADYRVSITDAAGATAYPIASFTYLLVRPKMSDAGKASTLKAFLKWALTEGQASQYTTALTYAPLPASLAKRVLKTVDQIGSNTVGAPKAE